MFGIFFYPPVGSAIYLLAIQWSSMYSRPGSFAIPVLAEIMAFLLFFLESMAVHLVLVLPACFLLMKICGSRYAGLILAPILAIIVIIVVLLTDWSHSWYGTIGEKDVSRIILPVIGMTLFAYHLVSSDMLVGGFRPWLAISQVRGISLVVTLFILVVVGMGSYWNQLPPHEPMEMTSDVRLEGEELLEVHALVIESLMNKPGGIISGRQGITVTVLDNMRHWESGVQNQIVGFGPLLQSFAFSTKANAFDEHEFFKATPDKLQDALNLLARLPDAHPSEADSLYRDALPKISAVYAELIPPGIKVLSNGDPAAWLIWLAGSFDIDNNLRRSAGNIQSALVNEDSYNPRSPSVLAIQPLWTENDTLYETYGNFWAMEYYLRAFATAFEPLLKEKDAAVGLENVLLNLSKCQAQRWSAPLLLASGMAAMAVEIKRVENCSERIQIELFHLAQAIR